jgi:N-acetylmuramoyl-L-alanine amidase
VRRWLASALALAVLPACSRAAAPAAPTPAGRSAGSVPPATAAPAPPAAPRGTPTLPRPPATPDALSAKTIVLDPGHNGGNAGAPQVIDQLVDAVTLRKPCDTAGAETAAGYPESAFSFDVAVRLAAILRAAGARVVLTRPDDSGVGPCITERAAIGNRSGAVAALSIHADGGPPNGVGFHVIEPADVGVNAAVVPASRRLALSVRDAYAAGTREPFATYIGSAGLDVRSDLGGLNLSAVPKVFIECANMRNPQEAARVTDPAFRQRVAQALAEGLERYLAGSPPPARDVGPVD